MSKRKAKPLQKWEMDARKAMRDYGREMSKIFKKGVQEWSGNNFLKASKAGEVDDVRRYLEADPALLNFQDDKGMTALMHASIKGHTSVVKELLSRKADVNMRDIRKETALMKASQAGHRGIVVMLLNKGAKISAQNEDLWTPLIFAAGKPQGS
jgi:uncharacterized protein